MIQEEEKQRTEKKRLYIPWLSLLMTGGSAYIYYCWSSWNHLKAQRTFVFSETNFLMNKNY